MSKTTDQYGLLDIARSKEYNGAFSAINNRIRGQERALERLANVGLNKPRVNRKRKNTGSSTVDEESRISGNSQSGEGDGYGAGDTGTETISIIET